MSGLSTANAANILRHGERALREGDRAGARRCLALLEEAQSLGAIVAAQILAEALRGPSSSHSRSKRAA